MRYAWFGGNVIKIKAAKGKREQAWFCCCPYLERNQVMSGVLHAFFGQFRVIYFCDCFNFGKFSVLFKFLAEQI